MKKTYEVRHLGACIARRETFKAALQVYEDSVTKMPERVVELVCVTEETILSTAEKLSSERGYASKNG